MTSRSRVLSALVMANVVIGALVALEVGGRLVAYGAVHWQRDARADADGYNGAEWIDEYYQEHTASGEVDWASYVYWRRRPFRGRFINVDEQGLRRTWTPPAGVAGPRVFVMGGSTVWGTGARDDQTIPSHLARELAARGMPASVVNFGEAGYVTRQDVTTLMMRLNEGDIPRVVVFYGGINDIFAAFQGGSAGVPQNERNRAVEFNATRPDSLGKVFRIATAGTQTIADAVRRRLLRRAAAASPPPADGALARAVIESYCADARTVHALGVQYGFQPMFFWQPVIFTKPELTAYERGERDRYNYAEPFFDLVYAQFGAGKQPCAGNMVRDISTIFASESRPMYADAFHLTESGNEVVARAITAAVGDVLNAPPATH